MRARARQVVINSVQYRGRLEPSSVLRAICAGFEEGTEPQVCLTAGLEARSSSARAAVLLADTRAMLPQVDECEQTGNGGCWVNGSLTACVDTFRGHKCKCPAGTFGNGYECADIDECALEPPPCDQLCRNLLGGYECGCKPGWRLAGVRTCVPARAPAPAEHHGASGVISAWAAFGAALVTALIAAAVYKWRMRMHMDREVRLRGHSAMSTARGRLTFVSRRSSRRFARSSARICRCKRRSRRTCSSSGWRHRSRARRARSRASFDRWTEGKGSECHHQRTCTARATRLVLPRTHAYSNHASFSLPPAAADAT
jgi:hypothetical protein